LARFLTQAEFEREIARLCDLPRPALCERWQRLTRTAPPKGISTALLRRALAYELQARRWQGLRQATRKRLLQTQTDKAAATTKAQPATALPRSGDRLVREWNGRTYVVEVAEDGYRLDGRSYRSLSAVARAITGARWSGPRFFGLSPGSNS
jgi:hypothetical protein